MLGRHSLPRPAGRRIRCAGFSSLLVPEPKTSTTDRSIFWRTTSNAAQMCCAELFPGPPTRLSIRVSSSKLSDEGWTRTGLGCTIQSIFVAGSRVEAPTHDPSQAPPPPAFQPIDDYSGILLWCRVCLKIHADYTADKQKADSQNSYMRLFGSASQNRRPPPTHPKSSLFCP